MLAPYLPRAGTAGANVLSSIWQGGVRQSVAKAKIGEEGRSRSCLSGESSAKVSSPSRSTQSPRLSITSGWHYLNYAHLTGPPDAAPPHSNRSCAPKSKIYPGSDALMRRQASEGIRDWIPFQIKKIRFCHVVLEFCQSHVRDFIGSLVIGKCWEYSAFCSTKLSPFFHAFFEKSHHGQDEVLSNYLMTRDLPGDRKDKSQVQFWTLLARQLGFTRAILFPPFIFSRVYNPLSRPLITETKPGMTKEFRTWWSEESKSCLKANRSHSWSHLTWRCKKENPDRKIPEPSSSQISPPRLKSVGHKQRYLLFGLSLFHSLFPWLVFLFLL